MVLQLDTLIVVVNNNFAFLFSAFHVQKNSSGEQKSFSGLKFFIDGVKI